MTDTSPLPSSIHRDARLSHYTDTLVRHVAEQINSRCADQVQREINTVCDLISDGRDARQELGYLTAGLTVNLGSTHMITEGIDDLIDLIVDTAGEEDPDAVERSWEPYALTFDGARYAE